MDYQLLHIKTVAELRQLAKEMNLRLPAGVRKATIIDMLLEREKEQASASETPKIQRKAPQKDAEVASNPIKMETAPTTEEPQKTETVQPVPRSAAPQPSAEPAPKVQPEQKREYRKPASNYQRMGNRVQPNTGRTQFAPYPNRNPKPTERRSYNDPADTRRTESPERRSYNDPADTRRTESPERRSYNDPADNRRTEAPERRSYNDSTDNRRSEAPERRSYNDPADNRRSEPTERRSYNDPADTRRTEAPERRSYNDAADNRRSEPTERRSYNDAADNRRSEAPERRSYNDAVDNRRAYAENQRPTADFVPEERGVNAYATELMASGECGDGAGVLEIHADGYGFLRAENYLPGNKDVYVSAAQIRRFNLRTGDYVVGKTRAQMAGDRSVGLIYINEINGRPPESARRRRPFDTLIPVYPNERLHMEIEGENNVALRLIDMIAPIGKGQRGMIVSQPKAGKTTLLKNIANSISHNHPEVHLIVLLIDERPEEVTEMKRCIQGEVVYSTFDEAPENHARVSEMVLERAQRLVELGKDVVILMDSITRLARAYNLVIPPTGRSLSGGLDPGALYKPKRFFGAARNIENGGSLTIIATALVDTGSRMDDIIYEEFKGTGNMELHLDRSLSDRRIFPAIDLFKSGTRREELLLDSKELDASYQIRRMLARGNAQEAAEQMISMVEKSKCNRDFISMLSSWKTANKKDGFN